jgi:hypothetical protein
MKGNKSININGVDYTFRFDLNALERFTEEAGVGLNSIDEALDKVANIKLFIQALSASGGQEVPKDAIGKMEFSQLSEVFDLVRESVGNLNRPQKKKAS